MGVSPVPLFRSSQRKKEDKHATPFINPFTSPVLFPFGRQPLPRAGGSFFAPIPRYMGLENYRRNAPGTPRNGEPLRDSARRQRSQKGKIAFLKSPSWGNPSRETKGPKRECVMCISAPYVRAQGKNETVRRQSRGTAGGFRRCRLSARNPPVSPGKSGTASSAPPG